MGCHPERGSEGAGEMGWMGRLGQIKLMERLLSGRQRVLLGVRLGSASLTLSCLCKVGHLKLQSK